MLSLQESMQHCVACKRRRLQYSVNQCITCTRWAAPEAPQPHAARAHTRAVTNHAPQVGQRYGLPLLSPVDDAGCFTDEAGPKFEGLMVQVRGRQL